MQLASLFQRLDAEILDADEETFLLFSQPFPSQDLGFVDARSKTIDISIGNQDLSITQSPGLLSSNRSDGTTGAVVWRVTPLVADWISQVDNVLFESEVLHSRAAVIEIGCGSSGMLALTLAPLVGQFVASDQDYVFKLLRHNLEANRLRKADKAGRPGKKTRGSLAKIEPRSSDDNVHVIALDWEKSSVASISSLLDLQDGFDLLVACDCIYNDALIAPFVNTCAEICRLRQAEGHPTICLVAQQLRSDEVFAAWLAAFAKIFRVWRLPDSICGSALSSNNGFVIHLGMLRSSKGEG